MQSITINITKKLTKASGFIKSYYNQFNQYGEFSFVIPDDIDTTILKRLLKTDKITIKKYDNNINQILYIVDYFQLNNIILELCYHDMSEYNEKYDIIKKKILLRGAIVQVINIPINTYYFECMFHCRKITGFIGSANIMKFRNTSLRGVIKIPEGVEEFDCTNCKNVTGFTGSANIMKFKNTSLRGVIKIPEGVKEFSCTRCENVTGFIGKAISMNFKLTGLSGIINIPEGVESFGCNQTNVTGFTGYANNMMFRSTLLPEVIDIPMGVEYFYWFDTYVEKVNTIVGTMDASMMTHIYICKDKFGHYYVPRTW